VRIKTLTALSLAVFAFSGLAYGQRVSLEAKAMYFQPLSSEFKDVYKGGLSFGGEIDVSIAGGLGAWAGGHVFSKTGKTTFTEEDTKLRLTPIYAGLRYRFGASRAVPYVGAGVASISYREESPLGEVSGSAIGYAGQAGVVVKLGKKAFFDVKAMYTHGKDAPVEVEADFSGFQFGVGVGISL
jgi:hypothetical protein